tara:strand:- start:225 stop:2069 length:1845 start_codon:yes stop_codon:yes gene_type:complete
MLNIDSNLKKTLENIPELPGIYQFFNISNEVIYIGKSRNLKKRVNSYFHKTPDSPRIALLVRNVFEIQVTVTNSETEALLLEINLIKRYSPRFNVLFKDGKSYPYIKLHSQLGFAYVEKVREVRQDGASYYGPFVQEGKVNRVLRFIDRHYKLIKCQKDVSDRNGKACLDYQIGRCDGPCFQAINQEEYDSEVLEVKNLLDGGYLDLKRKLTQKMMDFSRQLAFERAAKLRDQIRAITILEQEQDAISSDDHSYDVLAIDSLESNVLIQHLVVRAGKIVEQFKVRCEMQYSNQSLDEVLFEYIKLHYGQIKDSPNQINLDRTLSAELDVENFLTQFKELQGHKLDIHRPKRGRKKRLLDLAIKNVSESLKADLQRQDRVGTLLYKAYELLKLPKVPYYIECFDISNIQGSESVASMVVAVHGKMENKLYRHYKIRCKSTPDDFAMIKEAVSRRYSRLTAEGSTLPDLVLIDGGVGQLNSAAEALRELAINLPLASIAKREELIFVYGNDQSAGIQLGADNAVRLFFQTIRDEAHRFAITYHRKLRKKRTLHSVLEDVPGIGPIRRKKLLRQFRSAKMILDASIDEIISLGIPEDSAQNLIRHLKEQVLSGKLSG